jgi:histidinol phosphatase-like enzyme
LYYLTSGGNHSVLPQERFKSTNKVDLIYRAFDELNLDPQCAWLVGDRTTDIQAALNAHEITPILVRTGDGENSQAKCLTIAPNLHIADDLAGAADHILNTSVPG